MIVKKHTSSDGRLVIAICDTKLAGKKYHDDNSELDLSADFFQGEELEEDEAARLLTQAYSANIVGEESVALASNIGIIEEDNISYVDDIPFAYAVKA